MLVSKTNINTPKSMTSEYSVYNSPSFGQTLKERVVSGYKNKYPAVVGDGKSKPQEEYNDPLLNWPLRGLAFTNDIGAAIMDIAPTAGTLLWIPSLMYFGADIYDKYKNDQREYDPDKKRAFKQAVFQSLSSIMMPIVLVHNGQKAASLLGQMSKSGMSLHLREEIERFTINHLKRR